MFIRDDGYQDIAKVQVSLIDANSDGIPDDPAGFNKIVSMTDRVVFEFYTNEVTGYQDTRPWISSWGTLLDTYQGEIVVHFPVDPNNSEILYGAPYITDLAGTPSSTMYMDQYDLFFIFASSQIDSIASQVTAFFNNGIPGTEHVINKSDIVNQYFISKTFLLSTSAPGFGVYNSLIFQDAPNLNTYPTGLVITSVVDTYHYDKNGKAFTQNIAYPLAQQLPFYFKWSHYSPIDQRIDPAPSNIVDMIVITNGYYTDITNWKNNNGSLATLPTMPTTEDLRIQFQNLDQYKMVSDSIVWNSGEFKLLFGATAAPELQATFKVVKALSTSVSDNEIKTQVIQAIDIYFDIRNWDFGENFFYTELAAFIHQQLSRTISSVVIVPNNANSAFGSLFEIISGPNQLFISTATVNNVQIVTNLTDTNLRV